MTTSSKAHRLLHELSQFTGDLERFRSISPSLIYTPGVQYLAQEAHAYWLIDAIASYFPSGSLRRAMVRDPKIESLHFWRLSVNDDDSALLTARVDADEPPFIRQSIKFTDFPLEHIELWCGHDGLYWTLYLPSEH